MDEWSARGRGKKKKKSNSYQEWEMDFGLWRHGLRRWETVSQGDVSGTPGIVDGKADNITGGAMILPTLRPTLWNPLTAESSEWKRVEVTRFALLSTNLVTVENKWVVGRKFTTRGLHVECDNVNTY